MEYLGFAAFALGFGLVAWLLVRLLRRTPRNDGATHGGGGIGDVASYGSGGTGDLGGGSL